MADSDQVEGEVREQGGALPDDESLEKKGQAQEAWGGVKEKGEDAKDDQGWREDAPNPTQERIGEGEDVPVDASWREDKWGETPEGEPA